MSLQHRSIAVKTQIAPFLCSPTAGDGYRIGALIYAVEPERARLNRRSCWWCEIKQSDTAYGEQAAYS